VNYEKDCTKEYYEEEKKNGDFYMMKMQEKLNQK
jgi:hypothetical protein